ncbi:hypothetical protein F751_5450 [Auxenochlorella protothecoides]|uniref:Uncharacterized protein n=1 Tax=Auxenochlorella protothecoides TaxID=3075 RepID=A0A087SQ81_AUXPR|nr:hypothetical protein F751_5450 [Auxenochlorella protothecoides]KFM27885.1 hypothetical protein F751_5450 [Auxenochlorella protothecoides]
MPAWHGPSPITTAAMYTLRSRRRRESTHFQSAQWKATENGAQRVAACTRRIIAVSSLARLRPADPCFPGTGRR